MTAPARVGRRLPGWAVALLVVAAAVLAGAAAGRPATGGPPLDPTSTGPLGTKGLVDVLRELGATVDVDRGLPDQSTTAALVLDDNLPSGDRFVLRLWVEGGGTLVVADPSSPLLLEAGITEASGIFLGGQRAVTVPGPCPLPALAAVGQIEVVGLVHYGVPDGGTGCFTAAGGGPGEGFVVAVPVGRGVVVGLGGAGTLVNQQLDRADNAVLAAALLAPQPGAHVRIARPRLPGEGDDTLVDLVPGRAWAVTAQLVLAFVVVAAWRSRRLGRPVVEPQQVALEGSELVVAVGRLLHRTRGRAQAAAAVRADLARDLAHRLGLPPTMPAAELAATAAARTGVDEDRLRHALAGPVPHDEEALVALAQAVESVRTEVTGGSQGS